MPNTYFDTAKITGQVSSLVPVIDDFEDQGFSEYTGDTGASTIVSSPVANGSFAAQIDGGQNEIRSTSGLNTYPSQGDIWRFNTYIPQNSKPRFAWGVQDANNLYLLEFDEPNSTLRFIKREAGSESTLGTAAITFDTGAWLETEVEWRSNGRHLIEHFDSGDTSVGTIDVTDSTWASGGVAWGEWSAAPVTTGLKAWYKMDEGSGSTAIDYEGTNDATISGAAWTSDAKTGGQALEFDGNDDTATAPESYGDTNDISFTMWVKPDNTSSTMSYIARYDPSTDPQERTHIFRQNGSELEMFLYDTDGNRILFSSGPILSADTYQHVAGTFDGSSVSAQFYHNGSSVTTSLDADQGFTAPIDDRGSDLTIGHRYGASGGQILLEFYDGTLDDVRLYHNNLSSNQIQTIYDNTV